MSAPSDGNPLEQVQSILFGSQLEEISRRFEQLDKRLTAETTHVLNELRERVGSLEEAAESRAQALHELLDHQKRAGAESLAQLRDAVDEERASARERLSKLRDELESVRKAKPDRADLSAMLMDVARRLGGSDD